MWNGTWRRALLTIAVAGFSATGIARDGVSNDIYSVQKGAARDRGWLLTPRGVAVYDYRARGVTALVPLPGWVWAGEAYMCPPDLALGPNGEAVVSSNVLPSLWRVDPASRRVTKHDLALDPNSGRDVGFTGLTYSPQLGVYFGITDAGMLWRIDPQLRRAQKIPVSEPLPRACGLRILEARRPGRLTALCAHAPGRSWTLVFAPDQRSAYARPGCD